MKRLKEQAPQAFNLFMDKYNIYEYDTNKFHFFCQKRRRAEAQERVPK